MAFPGTLILTPVKGESDAAQAPLPGWMLEAARAGLLPRRATWFGPGAPSEGPALQTLRRGGWIGKPARSAAFPPGWSAPMLLLHPDAPADTLSASLLRAAQEARRRHTGGVNVLMCDGSVRFTLIGLLLPAVQKVRTSVSREPRAARYPLHFHHLHPSPAPAGQTRQNTVVLEI